MDEISDRTAAMQAALLARADLATKLASSLKAVFPNAYPEDLRSVSRSIRNDPSFHSEIGRSWTQK